MLIVVMISFMALPAGPAPAGSGSRLEVDKTRPGALAWRPRRSWVGWLPRGGSR